MLDFQKTTLSNGLRVIVERDQNTSLVAINTLYNVGSKNEDPDKTGFAHLFEHLMFGGSHNAPNYDHIIQNASGESNAFTNTDFTNYYCILPIENIETGLWLEADRMANLIIDSRVLEIQKKVVIEEFKEVCINKPYGDSWHHISEMAYPHHPYGWPTIGKELGHIQNANVRDVSRFHKTYYHPANAILTISGPIDPEEVFALCDKWFGQIKSRSQSSFQFPEIQNDLHQVNKFVNSNVPVPQFMAAFHMVGREHPDYHACDLLSDILANGKSSRLYQSLVRDEEMASYIDCYLSGTAHTGLIVIEGRPASHSSIGKNKERLYEILNELSSVPPEPRELQKVKNKAITGLALNELNVINKAISLAYFEWLGNVELINEEMRNYGSVQPEDICRVADAFLNKETEMGLSYIPS